VVLKRKELVVPILLVKDHIIHHSAGPVLDKVSTSCCFFIILKDDIKFSSTLALIP
jgi:hypothetical protein